MISEIVINVVANFIFFKFKLICCYKYCTLVIMDDVSRVDGCVACRHD